MKSKFSCFIITIVLLLFTVCGVFANNALTNITLNTHNDSRSSITLDFAQIIKDKPRSFVMQNPERIVLDFDHAQTNLNYNKQRFNSNLIYQIQSIGANNKLRLIIYLRKSAQYKITDNKNRVDIELSTNFPVGIIKPITISSFDFRPGEEANSGKIILDLSANGIDGDFTKKNNQFILTLNNAALGQALARKYDVLDFKTVVNSIGLHQEDNKVKLIANTSKDYELAAYQINKKYIIDIMPSDIVTKHNRDKPRGDRITLNFQNIPVRQVLQVIAEFTKTNIIISDEIQGNISLRLHNIPWDQALKLVLQTQGLVERKIGKIILVAPATELARQDQQELEAKEAIKNLGPLKTEIFHIKYGTAQSYFDTLESETNSLLSNRGKIILNSRTNILFIQDTPTKLAGIREYIQKTDIPVKQVEIEARIVTVNKSFEREIGIKWDIQKSPIANPNPDGDPAKRGFTLDLGTGAVGESSPGALALATISNGVLIGMELSALEAEGNGEILSSPRLLTADQQEALIEQGTEIPYLESTSSGAASVSFKKAVLSLRVTPQITPNNKVLLKLDVNQDAKSGETTAGDIPIIDTRHISTNVLVDNGETVVLGGIYERTQTKQLSRVPFLSSIPILGELFKHRGVTDDRKELLIFVTPKIVHHDLLNNE